MDCRFAVNVIFTADVTKYSELVGAGAVMSVIPALALSGSITVAVL